MKEIRKKMTNISLLLAGTVLFLSLASCKKQAQQASGNGSGELNITSLILWEKPILDEDDVALDSNANTKTLEIAVSNCKDYDVAVKVSGETYTGKGTYGTASVAVPEIPLDKKTLSVFISASGFNDKSKQLTVKRNEPSASSVTISFIREDDNKETVINRDGQEVSTSKTTAKLKISSPKANMKSVSINDVTIETDDTNSKELIHTIADISADKNISVVIKYKYHKNVTRSFKIKKVATQNDLPLALVSAKIFYGNNESKMYGASKDITFDDEGKAKVEIEKIMFSTVKLEMTFDSKLEKREVLSCDSGRENQDIYGKFAGYIVADVHPGNGEETKVEQIKNEVYTEYLLVGEGFAEFKIKVTAKNNNFAQYTLRIVNPTNKDEVIEVNTEQGKRKMKKNYYHDRNFMVFNGWSGRPTFYGTQTCFLLPFYNKGHHWNGENVNVEGFSDLAYIDKLSLAMQEGNNTPFVFYYNIYDENANKNEFKMMGAGSITTKTGKKISIAIPKFDMNEKYLDACVSFKDKLPTSLFYPYRDKKFRKIAKPTHNYMLELSNNVECTWDGEKMEASTIFDFAYNYRRQARYYEENNKNSNEKLLPIGKYQNVSFWELGGNTPSGWIPFLSGASDANKDIFTFSPLFAKADEVIQEVKHTIQTQNDSNPSQYDAVSDFTDVKPKKNEGGDYILGTIDGEANKVHVFADGKIYKVVVTVKYKDSAITDEKFSYLLDYKAEQSSPIGDVEFLSTDGFYSGNIDIFGVPVYYDNMQTENAFDYVDPKELTSLLLEK